MTIWQDVTYALRTFKKTPLFVVVAIVSLAFGIGANTAIFTLIDQVLLRMLPVKHPEQLVLLTGRGRHYGGNSGGNRLSYPMYTDFRDHAGVFNAMFCVRETSMSVSYAGHSERIAGELVSGNYFPVLGVTAAIGRVFNASDDQMQGGHPLAVLSYGYWQSRFGRNPGVIGQKINIDGYQYTIIGVSQSGFSGTDPAYSPEIRIPMMMAQSAGWGNLNERRFRWVLAFGRLKPGVSLKQAKASLQPFFHQILETEVKQKEFAKASPYMKQQFLRMWLDLLPAASGRSGMRQQFSKPLLVLISITGLVLLIACANIANLLLARAAARQKEMAVRLALGSGRRRIVQQLLVESLLLSLAGGGAGLVLAVATDKALIHFLPPQTTPLAISPYPDWRILSFGLAISILAGVAFGLAPALQATRPDVADTLKDQAGAVVGGGSNSVRKILVAAQVTLSLLLLIGAGLFIRSLQNLKDLDPGFRTGNLLAFKIDPRQSGYTVDRTRLFFQHLQDNLLAVPGVQDAAMAVVPVLEDDEWDNWITIDSYTPKVGELPDPHVNFVTPDYFKTLKIPLLMGRDFRATDSLSAPKVGIVNEAFAKKYFGKTNAIGHRVGMGIDPGTKTDITIVGVSRSTKYENLREEIPTEVFTPYQQRTYANGMTAYLRTTQDPETVFREARKVVHDLDPNLPVFEMVTLERQMENSLVIERLVATLSSGFGILATLLAAIGLYGVMAFSVARRTREIGIRMAIGAERGDVLWLVMREVLVLLAAGIVIALPASWALTQSVRSQLYGIEPTDPISLTAATLLIAAVAIAAGFLPARRATQVDPINALRYE
ncbi:MAG TPA: ABC transporter permease [Bryobacteraceae bacterium]|nr:ABC transporter permease [Bryobacteraceae bacterium]